MNSVDTLLDKINAAIRPLVEEAIAAERANIGVAFAEFLTSGGVAPKRQTLAEAPPNPEAQHQEPTVRQTRASPGSVKPVILDLIAKNPGITSADLQRRSGAKMNSVRGTLWTIQKEGLVTRRGEGFVTVSATP